MVTYINVITVFIPDKSNFTEGDYLLKFLFNGLKPVGVKAPSDLGPQMEEVQN